jgi:hypothetical protein
MAATQRQKCSQLKELNPLLVQKKFLIRDQRIEG